MGYEKSWATQSHSPLYNFMIKARLSIPFRSISSEMAETFHINSKNGTIFILFQISIRSRFFGWNVPISFHMFRSGLEKSLNQIEPGLI
jgi:hypothetical protein